VDDAQPLLDAVVAWAGGRPDVHAVVVVGSQARTDTPADRWSDLDLVLFVDDPAPYAQDAAWLEALGKPLLTFVEPTAVGPFLERRVLFATGHEVDFALIPLLPVEQPAAALAQPEVAAVFGRGYRVLIDKAGMAATLPGTDLLPPPRPLPTAAEFTQLTHDFWYHALWAAKKLRRGELWIAQQTCDGYLKRLLVGMLAWHAMAANPQTDTWHAGRFLERWADRRALADLPGAYAGYDADQVQAAVWATVDLFQWVEREVAARAGVESTVPHDQIRQRLTQILTAQT
jgi:aminoglycoside 6-adenylyltransferase